jgi:hypothetical protein
MGGGGAIQDMINSMRNNRMLLRKTTIFEQKQFNYRYAKSVYEKEKRLLTFKEAQPAQLSAIRKAVVRQQRRKMLKVVVSSLLILFLLVSASLYAVDMYYNNQKKLALEEMQAAQVQWFMRNKELGDDAFKTAHWDSAILFYSKALEERPNHFEVEMKLTRAYYYNCKYHGSDCFNAIDHTAKLLAQYPTNPTLLKMQAYFDQGF